jgi:hypothetical protein
MNLTLTEDEARFLKQQLLREIKEVDRELVRTDKHDLQHAIARDADKLRVIASRIDQLLAAAGTNGIV